MGLIASASKPFFFTCSAALFISLTLCRSQTLDEIMSMLYKRFTDKTAEEWRQIYKVYTATSCHFTIRSFSDFPLPPLQSLQLLEFLVKNGSERVVDDARTHIALLRMLRQFHYIDQNGKDQGLNVRNRSQELTKLLGDVDAIRAERKKARANRHKYRGFSGSTISRGPSFGSSSFGGFGSESLSYGEHSGGVYGDGGGFGGSEFSDNLGFASPSPRRTNRFEEYEEGDDPNYGIREEQGHVSSTPTAAASPSSASQSKKPEPAASASLIDDLVDLGSDEPETLAAPTSGQPAASPLSHKESEPPSLNIGNDVGLSKHQASSSQPAPFLPPPPPASTSVLTPKPSAPSTTASAGASIPSLASPSPPIQAQSPPAKTAAYQAPTPNYYTSVPATQPQVSPQTSNRNSMSSAGAAKPTHTLSSGGSISTTPSSAASKPASSGASGDAFGSLWSSVSASAGFKPKPMQQTQGPKLSSLAKDRTSAGIWNTGPGGSGSGAAAPKKAPGNDSSNLLG